MSDGSIEPGTVVPAQMNAQYVAAVKLLEGQVFVQQFREELLNDPRVMEIVRRISIRDDPEIDALGAARRHTVRATAKLQSGKICTAEVQQRKGSAERPLLREEIVAKFHSVAAAPFLDSARMHAAIMDIDTVPYAMETLGRPLLEGACQPR